MKTLIFLLSLFPALAFGQDIYDCNLPEYSDYDNKTWSSDDGLAFKIAVDRTNNKSVFIGNAGVSDIVLVPGIGAETFIEITETGNVITTTIMEDGSAVHSRNSVLLGTYLLASQYYGQCIKE